MACCVFMVILLFLIDVEIGLECMGKSSIFVGLIIRNADGVHRRME